MVVDVLARTFQRIRPAAPMKERAELSQCTDATVAPLPRAVDFFEQANQVSLDRDTPIAVGVAETHLRIADDAEQRGPIGDTDAGNDLRMCTGDALARPEPELDRGVPEGSQQPPQQAGLHRSAGFGRCLLQPRLLALWPSRRPDVLFNRA